MSATTSHATKLPGRDDTSVAAACRRLEAVMQDAKHVSRIANTLIETALSRGFTEARENGFVSLMFSASELEDLVYISNEAAFRATDACDGFYAALEGRAN